MRITNWKHFPWFVFVCLATVAACLLYVANFHPDRMPLGIHVPASFIQTASEHHSVGGTPLGLAFGAISLAIFVFAALLSLRKKFRSGAWGRCNGGCALISGSRSSRSRS